MAKIENTTVYPLTTPSVDDFIIGTDTSDENRTVSFSIESITATSLLQGLQSVLDTQNFATEDISLTGNITLVGGYIYPTQILAGGASGTAGQLLSSTGTGIQWVDTSVIASNTLQEVTTAGNTTTDDIVMNGGNILTTGSIAMSGSSQGLSLINSSEITLANNCTITTEDDIRLNHPTCVLDFNYGASISDGNSSLGTSGQIFIRGAAGVEWSTGIPSASMPTLQEVLTAGNTATAIGIQFIGTSLTTFSASSTIQSLANNVWSGTNEFSGNGGTPATSGINLPGSLSDGSGTGTSGQVLTSTATGVSWADLSTIGVSSVNASSPVTASTPATPITISPNTGGVLIRQNIYAGGSNIGCVPDSGTASTFLRGDGTWVTPTGAVSSVSTGTGSPSTGASDAIKITPTTGGVQVYSNSFNGSDKVGHVPDASAAGATTDFLRADGTWATPAGGSSGFGGLQTFMLTQAKTGVTANNYMTLALNNTNTTGDRTVFSTDLGASSPAVMAGTMTDGQHVAGCFLYNPVTSSCLTATPAMKCCDIYFQYLPEFSGHNWTLEIWKTSVCTSGTYTAAGSATVSSTAGTLTCDSITFVSAALQTLQLGEAYFITVKQDSTLVANDFLLNLTVRYEMVA